MMRAITTLPGRRKRAPRQRIPMLYAYPATHRNGEVTCTRGAWVKPIGVDVDKKFDASARLSRNIGDAIIVLHEAGEAYAEIVTIVSASWRETWTVKVIHGGAIPNGNCMVMGARKAKK